MTPRFELLEISSAERQRRRTCFGAGTVAQILVVAVLLWLLAAPPSGEFKGTSKVWTERITLLAPPPAHPLRRPRSVFPSLPPPVKQAVELPKVKPQPVVSAPPAVTAKLQPKPVPQPHPLPAIPLRIAKARPTPPRKELQTHVGAFSSSPAIAALKRPPSSVQTGGFGSPQGLPGEAEGGSHGNVPHLGSFDRPEGPGSGNGTGGKHGVQGMVASAGFGNEVAAEPTREHEGQVHSAGFTDAHSLTQATPRAKPQPAVVSFEPVVITAKPDPVYTAEARRLRIQGEVSLRVVFTASGQVRILGVMHGLGHGLDEAAVHAAQQIRFKPARRNGRPMDTPAILHILFQLAD